MSDYEIWIHPEQPDALMVKNADSVSHALKVGLHYSFVNYPGWFTDRAVDNQQKTYSGKFLELGYPVINEVTTWM